TTTVSPEVGFAAAVAEFGMLLRDSEFKGESSFAQARDLAARFKGDDAYGHRAEFLRMVGIADGLHRLSAALRRARAHRRTRFTDATKRLTASCHDGISTPELRSLSFESAQ